jgi:hypothetical protein
MSGIELCDTTVVKRNWKHDVLLMTKTDTTIDRFVTTDIIDVLKENSQTMMRAQK